MAEIVAPLLISTGLNLVASLFTTKEKQQEPDLRVPRSDYGSPLPKVYGRVRIEGNKFWPDTKDRMYRKKTKRQGKGGGGGKGQTQTTYSGTFAVLFCQGKVDIEAIIINGKTYDSGHSYFQEYLTWFDGTQTNSWSEMQVKDESPYTNIAYTNIAYAGFLNLPLEEYGNQIPQQVSAILVDKVLGDNPKLDTVIIDICTRAGIDPNLIDATEVNYLDLNGGFIVNESGEGYRNVLEKLFQVYLLTAIETRVGTIKIKRIGNAGGVFSLDSSEYFPVSANGVDNQMYTKTETSPSDLPSKIVIKFNNILESYNQDEVVDYMDGAVKENETTIDSGLFTFPSQLQERVRSIRKYLYLQQKTEYTFKIPASVLTRSPNFELLDVVTLPNGDLVQVEQFAFGADFLIECRGRYYSQTESFATNVTIPTVTPEIDPTTDIPELFILDIPTFDPNIPPNTLYGFARKPCVIYISLDNNNSFAQQVNHEGISTYGNVLTTLASASGLDITNTVDIELQSGLVASITTAQLSANLNLAVIAKLNNGVYEGEIIQFRDVTALGNNRFRLSYLNRGLFGTSTSHTLPEKFFLLTAEDNVYYSKIEGSTQYIDSSITFTPVVATYQNLATSPNYTVTPQGNSYKPPAPTNLSGTITPDGNITYTWQYTPSFSNYNNSQEFVSYSIDVLNGSNQIVRTLTSEVKSVIYSVGDRTNDGLGTNLTIRVTSVSSVAGNGGFTQSLVIPTAVGYSDGVQFQVNGTNYGVNKIVDFLNGSNVTITGNPNNGKLDITINSTGGSGGSGSITVQDEGVALSLASILNFIGQGITATNDIPNNRINITLNDSYYLNRQNHTGTQLVSSISNFVERLQEEVNNLLVAGDNITLNYDDVANTLTINAVLPTIDNETIDDRVNNLLVAGDNITLNYDDVANTLTINAVVPTIDNETIDDRVNNLLVAGDNITLDYNDSNNTLTISSQSNSGINIQDIWLYQD